MKTEEEEEEEEHRHTRNQTSMKPTKPLAVCSKSTKPLLLAVARSKSAPGCCSLEVDVSQIWLLGLFCFVCFWVKIERILYSALHCMGFTFHQIQIKGKMLGQILVTKQTGPQGKIVSKVYLCQKLSLVNEMYFAITLDRKTAGPLIIACRKGGTSIEDLAEKFPDMIIKVPIDVFKGITDEDAAKVVDGLALKVADRNASIEQVKKLYKLFCETDCTLLEINPIAETSDKQLVAADAKLNFDDNAAFRQKEIFALRDPTQEDPREVAAAQADLNYIGLDGEIGCMVNGAGLAMATMDIIKLRGGTPANFLDVGGNASEGQVVEAFKILTSDDKVKAILVNVFAGILKCDVIASGIVNAAKLVQLKVPVVVRLEGTNVDQGKSILKESGLTLITAEDLDDAAEKAVKAAYN